MSEELTKIESETSLAVPSNMSAMMTNDIIFDDMKFARMESLANMMASGRSTVPEHLRGKPGDCMAVIMQAAQWNMLGACFAVAQKSYFVGGVISYEAQLVNAVIIKSGILSKRPEYEAFGDWSKVAGKVTYKTSSKGNQYAAQGWSPADEVGLGVKVTIELTNGQVFDHELLLVQATVRNSTNWVNNPQQQLCYQALQQIVRRYAPDVLLGVYTNDEISDNSIEINEIPTTSEGATTTEKLGAILEDRNGAKVADVEAEPDDSGNDAKTEQPNDVPKAISKKILMDAIAKVGHPEATVLAYCISAGAIKEGDDFSNMNRDWKVWFVQDPEGRKPFIDQWIAQANKDQEQPTQEAMDNLRKRLHALGNEKFGKDWDATRKSIVSEMFNRASSSDLIFEEMQSLIQRIQSM